MAPKLLQDATPADFDAAREKARRDPDSLTEADRAVLEQFGGPRWRENTFFGPTPAASPSAPEPTDEIARLRADLNGAYDVIDKMSDAFAKLKAFAIQMNEQNKARNRRLDALEARPLVSVKDAGVWEPGATYAAGDIVTFNGSGWICRSAHVSVGAAPQPDAFRLFVKRGKDGRDRDGR